MCTYEFISSVLSLPPNAIGYTVGERLSALRPDAAIVDGGFDECDLERFAAATGWSLALQDEVYNERPAAWDAKLGIYRTPRNAWYHATRGDVKLEILLLTWAAGYCESRRAWIIGETLDEAEGFYAEAEAWSAEVREEVFVFDGGYWSKSDTLFRSIRSATFENLVLAGTLKDDIRCDLEGFFASRELYERYGVPWKRGVLFVGPPGNGKTHAVKSIVNALGRPCLYVKSLRSAHATDHDAIREVFARARSTAPCVLVLEDLDSLLHDDNRSFFLNELDGFAANAGIATVATANHPEKLDPAIIDRPSRFDRKYHFGAPGPRERLAYARLWAGSLEPALRPSEAGIERLVERTDDFSFAYMKELFLSATMRWMARPEPGAMDGVLVEQAAALRIQMATPAPIATAGPEA